MKKLSPLLPLAIGMLLGAWLTGAQPNLKEQLLQADRDFDKLTAAKGADGWAASFAEDGRMFGSDGNPVIGRARIREMMAPTFANPKNTLRWQPDFADAAASGDLGYTSGRSQRHLVAEDGTLTERDGRYITIWRKQKDGTWKVVADIGNSGPPRTVRAQ